MSCCMIAESFRKVMIVMKNLPRHPMTVDQSSDRCVSGSTIERRDICAKTWVGIKCTVS